MFKRVDRRRKRKEKEERLGLDEDQLEVFGLHHTDSSESESDSSDSESTLSSRSSSDGPTTQSRKKRKREASSASDDEGGEDEDSDLATDDEEDEERSSDHGTDPPLTIASALKEPIRPHSDSEAWMCALCPGKILKHAAMVQVHEASRIHQRRFKRVQELAMEFSPDEDIRKVLVKSATAAQPKADSATLSLRAQKRIAKQAKLKERRKKIKEKKAMAMAKANAKKATKTTGTEPMAGDPSDTDGATHSSKRLKVAPTQKDPPEGAKNVHRTTVQAKGMRILTDAGRKKRKEATEVPVSDKSKKRR